MLVPGFVGQAGAFDVPGEFDPYEVRDIAISAVAENAVVAKEEAMGEALTTSARRVLKRVAVSSGGIEVDAKVAESLLSMFENSTEQFGPGGYSATVTVRYSPLLVRGYLAKRGIGVVDQAAPPVLLIPMIVEDDTQLWWEEAVDWGEALAAYDMEDGLTPVVVARGTGQDKTARHDRLMEADFITLGEFRIRHRTHAAAVVRLDRTTAGEGMLVTVLGSDAAGQVNATVEVTEGTLEGAAAAVAEILSDRWKKVAGGADATQYAAGSSLPVRVLLPGGPGDWELLKRRLEKSGVVDGLAVEGMSGTAGNVVIWYAGRLDELPARLARSGIDLFEAGGAWLIQAY